MNKFAAQCLHEIFEARVGDHPDKIAVSTVNEQISYEELNLRANQLALRLQTLGVGKDVLVGLCVDRSIELIVGLLAILKSGGAYVPIDPDYPSKRIHLLLDDSALALVVTVSRVQDCLSSCSATIVCIDQNSFVLLKETLTSPLAENNGSNLAYMIYTSGSTGIPKGVLIEHRNVIRLFEQTHSWFDFDNQDVWTLFHSTSFDFSVWEIWGALLYGGHLVIVPFEVIRSPKKFHNLLRSKKVTILCQTPSAFRQLVAADMSSQESIDVSLRLVFFGGEALELNLLRPWIARYGDQRPKLVNMYGITETTVHATYRPITKEDLENNTVFSPIGIPIPDLQIYLLDKLGQHVPVETTGDLYVAGAGVARGYHKRPELNAERFLPNPYGSNSEFMYYSGDRALRRSNGELIYLGRSDEQIKVRGFRIEPREIELCLSRYSQITTTIVIAHDYDDGDVRLIAYIVPNPDLNLNAQLTERLSRDLAEYAKVELPVHMRPSAYVIILELPLTEHGKIDRHSLPLPIINRHNSKENSPKIKTSTEQKLTSIWEAVLEVKGIDTNDDFFSLGGTSLTLIRIFGCVNEYFKLSLDISVMVEGATISRLASCIDKEIQNSRDLEIS